MIIYITPGKLADLLGAHGPVVLKSRLSGFPASWIDASGALPMSAFDSALRNLDACRSQVSAALAAGIDATDVVNLVMGAPYRSPEPGTFPTRTIDLFCLLPNG